MSHIQAGSGDGSISQEEILKLIEKLKNANFGPLDQAMAYKTNLSAADQKPEAKKEEITISEDLMDKSIGEQTTKPKKVKKTIKVKKKPDIPKNLLDLKVIHLPGRMPVLNVSTYDVAKVIGSIFEKLKISAVIKILESKIIEQIFLLTNVSKKTPQTDQLLAKKSNNYVSPLEDKRQRNIFICMRPFNGDISRILALADSLDTDSELPDVIQSMKNSLPTQAEIDFAVSSVESCLKQNPDMDISQLPAVDQFVYNLAPYKDIIHHFEILIEMIDFEEECDILSQYLDAIFMSSRSLSNSELVNILLSIILALVNYFNSQKRGIVYGFSIEYLPQIDQIKSKTYEQITLMHLIAYFMLQNFEYLVGSRIDFTYLAMASTLKMDEIIARTRTVGNRVKKIRDEMERRLLGLAGKNSYSYSVKPEFESKVKKFENLYSELNENLTLTQVAYLEVAKLFNIQKLDQSTVIFESWKAFFKNFSDALADLETPKISQIFYGKQKTPAKETEQNGIIEEELSASDNT
ncbi:MAG: Formin-like protein 2, partial [Paramarteilia canceri]